MLQTLEREPQEDLSHQVFDASPAPGRMPFFLSDGSGGSSTGLNKRDNPHKYLLYKPTFSQLFTFLASGFKELPPTGIYCLTSPTLFWFPFYCLSTGAMLLYVSADGSLGNAKHTDDSKCSSTIASFLIFPIDRLCQFDVDVVKKQPKATCTVITQRMIFL
jgi:hypothetical protein